MIHIKSVYHFVVNTQRPILDTPRSTTISALLKAPETTFPSSSWDKTVKLHYYPPSVITLERYDILIKILKKSSYRHLKRPIADRRVNSEETLRINKNAPKTFRATLYRKLKLYQSIYPRVQRNQSDWLFPQMSSPCWKREERENEDAPY